MSGNFFTPRIHSQGIVHGMFLLSCSWKYWQSLNWVVWPQTERKKYWRNLNLAVVLCSVIRHYKHCECVYQGALPSSCLRYLNKAVSSQIYKKYNWQHVNDELAIRTACEKGRRAGPRALQHVLCLTRCGRGQYNIGGF